MKRTVLNHFLHVFVLLCVVGHNSEALFFSPDILPGFISQVPNILPTVEEIFEMSIYLLFGLPEQFIASIIDSMCSYAIASHYVNPDKTPSLSDISFQFRTPSTTYVIPLDQVSTLLSNNEFNVRYPIVIFIGGWYEEKEQPEVERLVKAYHCRGNINVLILDITTPMSTFYDWAAYNTDIVGSFFAEGLKNLVDIVPLKNIDVVGHSLGAHVAGYGGRYFTNNTNKILPRIIALDASNICFQRGHQLTGLLATDAKYVIAIHTNNGVLGEGNTLGDVDFFVGGKNPIQPGCYKCGCSHLRALQLFTETVVPGNENSCLGRCCDSMKSLDDGLCNGPESPMGYATPTDLKGIYILRTNGEQPYGKNAPTNAELNYDLCNIE